MAEEHYTYQEIKRQPNTWAQTIEQVLEKREIIKGKFNEINPEEVIFTGCGTSFYISIAAALIFQEQTGLTVKAVPASEIFLNPDTVINKKRKTLIIGSSRSGNTTEVVRAIDYVQKNNLASCLSVTCNPKSQMATITDETIVLPHVQEKSVVMTSSFTNLLLTMQIIAGIVSEDEDYLSELKKLPLIGIEVMQRAESIAKKAGEDLQIDHFIYLGLSAYLGLANEGMLKMKEMTQVFSEAFNPMEFRHGPISVVDRNCCVVLLSQQFTQSYEKEVIKDVRSFGGSTIVLGDQSANFESEIKFDLGSGLLDKSRGILYLPFLQYLAYYRTLKMGLNPDKPKNLKQVVVLGDE